MSEREGDELRRNLLSVLRGMSDADPDLRICQLIGNVIPPEEMKKRNNDIYYIEDSDLLKWLAEYQAKFQTAQSEGKT